MSKKDETFFIIANGGYLKKPIVKKLVVTQEDIDEALEEGEEEEDALQYILSETAAEFEQGFSRTIILTKKEFSSIKKLINAEIKNL